MMMNPFRFFLLLATVALLAGCALFETTTYSPDEAPVRIVITPTPLFYQAPVNDRADEYLPTGTVVQVIRKSFGYSFVRKESGVTGYVPNEDLAETDRPFGFFNLYDANFLIPDLPDNGDLLVLPQDNEPLPASPNPPKETPVQTPAPSKKIAKETPVEQERPTGIAATTSDETADPRDKPSLISRSYRSLTRLLWPWSGGNSGGESSEKSSDVKPSAEPEPTSEPIEPPKKASKKNV